MNYNIAQQSVSRARQMLMAVLVLGCALAGATQAAAERIAPPATPTAITPPTGNSAFLFGHALGTQGYTCLPKDGGASWTVNASRPEATLFVKFFGLDIENMTHYLSPNTNPNENAPAPLPFGSPTWQSTLDSAPRVSRRWNNSVCFQMRWYCGAIRFRK